MQDIEFINAIEGVLDEIEARCEGSGADIVVERSGNVLNLEFDNGSRIVREQPGGDARTMDCRAKRRLPPEARRR